MPSTIARLAERRTLWQLARYALSSSGVLGFKTGLMWALLKLTTAQWAYAGVHVLTFFFSYAVHSRVTFRSPFTRTRLWQYFQTVIGFKIVDYLVFSVIFYYFEIHALAAVLLASVAILLLRFAAVRRVLGKRASPVSPVVNRLPP